jgi:transposase
LSASRPAIHRTIEEPAALCGAKDSHAGRAFAANENRKVDIGLQISRATLDGWVLKVGELLIPMVAAMRRELISGSYIQADETPVDVQTHEGRGKNHQAYLSQYGRPGGSVVFDFRLGRGRDGPKRFLGQFEGILQTDGYTAYDQIGGTRMVHAACWAHARRQFFEAVQLNSRDPLATPIVARMDALFAVDVEARRRVIGLTGRHALRQERATPLLDDIRSRIETEHGPLHCPPVHSARSVDTLSHFGGS